MKLNYFIFLTAALLFTACDDPRNDNMSAPAVFLINSGDQLIRFYDVETTADVNVYAYCSGLDQSEAPVAVRVSPEALDKYNTANGTSYQMLDAKYYELLHLSQVIPVGERRGVFPVRFNCEALSTLENMQQYVVPLQLISEGTISVNEQKSVVLVRPDMWKAEVVMTTSGLHQQVIPPQEGGVIEYEVKFKTEFQNKKECDLNIDTSAKVLDDYNAANGTLFKPFPAGSFEIIGDAKLPAGAFEATLKVRVDLAKITQKGVYSLPVCLTSTSCYEVSKTKNLAIFRVMQEPDAAPEPLARSLWSNELCNSYQASKGYLKMIDGDPATLWEARYSAGGSSGVTKCPFEIVWNFGESVSVNGIGLMRRSEASYVTDLKSGYFEVSADNAVWYRVAEFDYDKSEVSPGPFRFYFEKTDLRYLRLVITATNRFTSNYDACSVAELYTYCY